jgi:hypothetical protein
MSKSSKLKKVSNEDYFLFLKDSITIKENSKTTYINALKALINKFNTSLHNIIYNPKKYATQFISKFTLNTQKTYFTAVLTLMNHSNLKNTDRKLYNEWYTYFIDVKRAYIRQLSQHEPTERQKDAHVNWEEAIKAKDKYPIGSDYNLVLAMYTMIPPRRQWDYMRVRVYTDTKDKPKMDHNHIHLNAEKGAYIFLNEYKTVKTMKNYFKSLPEELVKVIKASLDLKPRQYLFVKRDNQPYDTVQSFTFWTNYIFKKAFNNPKISVNTLRHSYENYIQQSKPDMTARERMQTARDMGHSVMQSILYRLKITKDDINKTKVDDCYTKDDKGELKEVKCIVVNKSNAESNNKLQATKIKIKGKLANLLRK